MTVPMALFDFVPVFFFGLSGVLLLRVLYRAMSKGAYALLAGGLIMSFFAGFLKATWKLLYAANICDFEVLNRMFLPTQALGFMLTGCALVALLVCRQHRLNAVAPAAFSGSMIFIAMMVLGCAGMCGSLAVLAKKMKKPVAILLFVLAFVLMMAMGYLAAKVSQEDALMNWIEEGVNTCGQICLFLGVRTLQKAGLADVEDVRKITA